MNEKLKDKIVNQLKERGDDQGAKLMEGRYQVVLAYCKIKGLNSNTLSFDLLMKIRATEAWKKGNLKLLKFN